MKRIVLMIAMIVHSGCLYGMEALSSSYTFKNTKVTLMQALLDVSNLDGRVSFICLGGDQSQLHNKKNNQYNEFCVGDVHLFHRKSVIIEVVEPLLHKNQYDAQYSYFVEKHCLEKKGRTSGAKWYGSDAIAKASQDLGLCYQRVLALGLQQELCKKNKKSIALPALGAIADFPKEQAPFIAVFEILTFIKNNPKAYSSIYLFVKDKVEFELCTALLDYYQNNPLEKLLSL